MLIRLNKHLDIKANKLKQTKMKLIEGTNFYWQFDKFMVVKGSYFLSVSEFLNDKKEPIFQIVLMNTFFSEIFYNEVGSKFSFTTHQEAKAFAEQKIKEIFYPNLLQA